MKHFKTEAKWMLIIPAVILVVGFVLALVMPYLLNN